MQFDSVLVSPSENVLSEPLVQYACDIVPVHSTGTPSYSAIGRNYGPTSGANSPIVN